MKEHSFYDAATGMLAPYVLACPDEAVQLNTPAGHIAIDGAYSAASQIFDIPSGAVIARGATPITAAIAARAVTLSGVPSGAAFAISGDATLAGNADATGTLALTFGAAGTYAVAIPCFPLLDYLGSFTLA